MTKYIPCSVFQNGEDLNLLSLSNSMEETFLRKSVLLSRRIYIVSSIGNTSDINSVNKNEALSSHKCRKTNTAYS